MALRNLRRHPFRSLAIGAAMALLAGSLLVISTTLEGTRAGVSRGAGKLGADIVVVARGAPVVPGNGLADYPLLAYDVLDAVGRVEVIVPRYGGRPPERVPGVAVVSPQLLLWLPPVSWAPGGVRLTGFDPATDLTVLPWLETPLAAPLGPGEVLVGHRRAHLAGRALDLGGEGFTVAGVLQRAGNGDLDDGVFLPLPAAWRLWSRLEVNGAPVADPRPLSSIQVRTRPGVETQRVANFIRSTVPDVQPRLTHRALAGLGGDLRLSVGSLGVIAAAIWLTALLLVGSASTMVVRERQRELGLLRALGATRRGVLALLAAEMAALCTAGGLLGVAAAALALTAMGAGSGPWAGGAMDGAPGPWSLALLSVLAAPVTGLLAALPPAVGAVMLEPHAAIQDSP